MLLSVVLSVVFFFFILEGVSTVIARPRSVCELFFYLDVVATLSLIAVRRLTPAPPLLRCGEVLTARAVAQDIVWIQEAIAGDASEELTLTRSARLARVGARAARLARMARVLRVLKVVKVTLLAKTSGKRHNIVVDDDEESTSSLPTSIMEQVSDSVTRHVVQIVLVSVIGAAALQYYEENQAASAAFAVMTEASATSRLGQTQIVADTLPNMYYLEISKFDDALIDKTGEQRYQDLRASETVTYKTGPDDDCVECIAMVDTSVDKVKQATLNMSLIVLIILVLLVATMSLSRETAQIVLEPTLKVMRMSRTSRALMSVFRAVGDSDGKSGLDDTISTVLDAALKMLSAEVVSMYFVDGDGNLKLHQCARDGAAEGTDVKGRLYGDVLSIGDAQTGTVIGSVITDAKQKFNSEDNTNGRTSSYANLLWVPEMDGVVDMTAHASIKRSMSLRRTMSKLAKGSSSAALQTALIDDEWTGRWQADPSINSIKLKKAGSSRYVALVGDGPVRNQLCMAVVAEVGGRHRVVGMVQALNRRIAKRHVRYEGDVQLTDLAFNREDVSSLEVFCMQIADLVQMKLKEVQYEDALNRTDGIGSMLRALELEADGMNASPRLSAAETEAAGPKNHTFKTAAEAVKFATRTSLAGVNAADKLLPIDQLRRWGHGCLDHSRTELTHYTVQMFDDLGLLSEFQVQDASLFEFADRVFSSYNQVPYHNAYHAFNVMQGCYVFCSTMNKGKSLLKTEQFALMVSALGHDSGHDGVNNAFHVGYESEIATLYNDLSPLENMHARRTLGILKEEDIMARIAPAERKAVKAMMVSLIIATDMKFHKDKELKLAEVSYDNVHPSVYLYSMLNIVSVLCTHQKHEFKVEEDAETRGDAQALMECVLHGIDIGHPTYSWEEECRWARLVATEFQAQVRLRSSPLVLGVRVHPR